jgi:hypothetical protein
MADGKPKLRIVDNPAVQTVFADTFISAQADSSAMRVVCGETRFLPGRVGEGPKDGEHPSVHVTMRLALTPTATIELVNSLTKLLDVFGVPKETPQEPAQKPKTH